MKKILKITVITVLSLIVIFAFAVVWANFSVLNSGKKNIKAVNDAPATEYILVFGASVHGNEVSFTLSQRLDKTVELYNKNSAGKIIVSGDHSSNDYNEVQAMKDYLVKKGIPEDIIIMNHSGVDTYTSVLWFKENISSDNVTFVTHDLHLKRALYYAGKCNINAFGVACDDYSKEEMKIQNKREFLARMKAFVLCEFFDGNTEKFNKTMKVIFDEDFD